MSRGRICVPKTSSERNKHLGSLKNYKGVDELIAEQEVFVLKDSRGNFVGVNSISYDKRKRKNIYSYSEIHTNGYRTYTNIDDAKKILYLLQEKGTKIKFGIHFHIEKVNRQEVVKNEYKLGIIKTCPFKHMVIDEIEIDQIVNSIGISCILMDYRTMVEVGV